MFAERMPTRRSFAFESGSLAGDDVRALAIQTSRPQRAELATRTRPQTISRKPTKMDGANEDVDLMDAVNMINLTAVPDVVTGQDRGPPVRGSPAIALFICIPLLLLLCRYRQAVMPFLRWSRSFPLRRHLGGRGRYESVSQMDLPSLNT